VETGGYTRAFETGKIDLGDQYNFLTGAFSPPARKPYCVWFCRRTSFRKYDVTIRGSDTVQSMLVVNPRRGALVDLQVGIGLTTFAPNIR
jgi:hypothetical protein